MKLKPYQVAILEVLKRTAADSKNVYGYALGYGCLGNVVWPAQHKFRAAYRKQGVAMNASKAIKRMHKMGLVHEHYVQDRGFFARITDAGLAALEEHNA